MVITRTLHKPRIMPYGFNIDINCLSVCRKWCNEQFKEGEWTSRNRSYWSTYGKPTDNKGYASIYFIHEEDAAAFKLRWS